MIDIRFYMKVHDLKRKLMARQLQNKEDLLEQFDQFRSKTPVVFNIETTNACNMKCTMCPRTTLMTRRVQTLDMETYYRIVEQIEPFSDEEWSAWEDFVEKRYAVPKHSMNENHFFLYIIPKVVILHGYGDPLLDRHIAQRVKLLAERNVETYFSCNPTNIDIEKTIELFESGISYMKYSIESVDDEKHIAIRGRGCSFDESYKKIVTLLGYKKKYSCKTVVVISMIDFNNSWQQQHYDKLRDAFQGKDVYIYLKSQDQHWYKENTDNTKSIHWSEFCQFPWSSLTINSQGGILACGQDYNGEIVLGNARTDTLLDVWNGEKYRRFRDSHLNPAPGIKCTDRCDMTLAGDFLA
ncbi:MAG: radical SAM protein [Planctomycetes bacterium]|nr:radical SAM protein [Planctomycetota bacterium]